jgi:predicted Ser/Thr protein kinase
VTESTYLAAGTVLQQRYEIQREIGRGGYSVVYLARDRKLGTDVAIKLLVPPPAAARLARERMRREVQSVRSLAHPNVVQVFDFGDDGPWSFIVMEYVAGPDLLVQVREHGVMEAERAAAVGRDVAAALALAHRRGILHRDVKPQNILLDPSGGARLTDFGSARLSDQATVTATGGMVGTPDYAAPEVLAGARGDARADVYGLGLSLYYALTGALPRRPSAHLPPARAARGHSARAANGAVPAWLDAVVARATVADPEDRFSGAQALAAALEAHDGAAVEPALPRGEPCLACGGPDPLALGICPRCAGTTRDGDTLVFARRSPAKAVAQLLGSTARRSEVRDAADGARPLVLVPAAAAEQVIDRLGERGIAARAVPARRAWAAAPIANYILAAAVVVAGLGAGSVIGPVLFWPSPFLAVLLTASAWSAARRPVAGGGDARRRGSKLPVLVRERVVATLAELQPGPARNLLGRLVRRMAALYLGVNPPAARVSQSLESLVLAACAAALELARLETAAGAIEGQVGAALTTQWMDAQARCDAARDVLVQRLLDADAALGRVQSGLADAAGSDMVDLTRDLEREAELQAAAAREVEALLR